MLTLMMCFKNSFEKYLNKNLCVMFLKFRRNNSLVFAAIHLFLFESKKFSITYHYMIEIVVELVNFETYLLSVNCLFCFLMSAVKCYATETVFKFMLAFLLAIFGNFALVIMPNYVSHI